MAAGQTFVPPNNWHALVYAFAVLDIIACLGMFALLVVSAWTKRLRSNILLLNFELVFFVTAAGQSFLVWTGHSFNLHPPRGLCLVSRSFVATAASMKAGAAFALTCKIWAHTMTVAYPRSRLLHVASSSLALGAVAWTIGLPLFFIALSIGVGDSLAIQRTSVYYCILDNVRLGLANMAIAAVLEVLSLVLAGWTALLVTQVRRRLRSLSASTKSPIHYSLVMRTLIFSFVLFIALAVELAVALTNLTAPIPGMAFAIIDFVAFIIFATDPVLLRSMSRRLRGEANTSFATGGPSQPPNGISVHITTSGPVRDEDWQNTHSLSANKMTHSFTDRSLVATKVDEDGCSLEDGEPHKTELSTLQVSAYPPRR